MTKETVGKISSDLLQKESATRDPIELEREMHKDYERNVWECVDRSKKEFNGDFYVVVVTKKERLMPNVLRNYFMGRNSCPTPEYDQTVYKYSRNDDHIEFLWVVPSKDTCELMRDNALQIADDEKGLLYYVLSFYDGSLLKKSKQLNREKEKSNIIEN